LIFRIFVFFASCYNFAQLLFELFALKEKAVLIPNKFRPVGVKLEAFTGILEHVNNVVVIWFICKGKLAAIFHKFLVFRRLVFAELLETGFLLFLFDGVVLLCL
jgi:hypothetical protein